MKKFKLLFIFILSFVFVGVVNAAETYHFYTGSDGVKWEIAYDETNVKIALYEKPDSVTKIVVPAYSELSSLGFGADKKYILVNHFKITGYTPTAITKNINSIDMSNVKYVDGVDNILNPDILTTLIFAENTVIGGTNVFAGGKLNISNIQNIKEIGVGSFKNTILSETDLNLGNLSKIGESAFAGSNVTKVYINTETISAAAFKGCKNLTGVVLGIDVRNIGDEVFQGDDVFKTFSFNQVRTIGNYSFADCPLFAVNITDTLLTSIGDGAFMNDTGYVLDVTIPNKVSRIGYATFRNSGIKTVNLNNVTSIGSEAFSQAFNLYDVNFGKTETIEYRAFYDDPKLETVKLSDSVYHVATQAFQKCSISSLDLNKIQRLDYQAFDNNKLTEIYLPKSLVFLTESSIFSDNPLVKATVAYDTLSNTNVINFETMIGHSTAQNIKFLVVEAPYKDGEEAIVTSKFNSTRLKYSQISHYYYGDDLPNLGNADGLRNVIRSGYFYGMRGLTNIVLGEGYEFIGEQAFYTGSYSETIESVDLPKSLKGIGGMAFAYVLRNPNLKMQLPEGIESIGYQAFYYDTGFKNDINFKELRYIGQNAFMESGITGYHLYDKLNAIGDQAFFHTPNVRYIVFDCDFYAIPNIGYGNAFNFYSHFDSGQEYDYIEFTDKVVTEPHGNFLSNYENTSFFYKVKTKKLLLGETGWKNISPSNFANESKIGYLTLPKNLTAIGDTAFYNSTIGNDNLVIPDTVTAIGRSAFQNAKVHIEDLPADLKVVNYAAFYNCDFDDDIVIPEGVVQIQPSAFQAQSPSNPEDRFHRKSIEILCPLTATVACGQSINQLFYNTDVDYIHLGPNVTELPTHQTHDSEFYGMKIKEVKIDGIETLPSRAFQDCELLEKVDFSDNDKLNRIETLAFYNANSLHDIKFYKDSDEKIYLGSKSFTKTGFKSIGGEDEEFDLTQRDFYTDADYIFSDSDKLEYVYVPNSFNEGVVPEYAFTNCHNLKTVDIDYDVKTISNAAFNGDEKIEKFFLWGDTEVIQKDEEIEPIKGFVKYSVVNNSTFDDFEITIMDSVKGATDLTVDDFTDVNGVLTYVYETTAAAEISLDNSYFITPKVLGANIIFNDLDPSQFTIPANADVYAYSTNSNIEWDEEYELFRRNERLGTDSTVYPLDEVIYLASNKEKVKLTKNKKDFDKDGLIVYALRRDGVVLESDDWSEYSSFFYRDEEDINFKYSDEKEMLVYDTLLPEDLIDVSNENFENIDYELIDVDGLIDTKKIVLLYTDKYTENDVDTLLRTPFIPEIVETGAHVSLLILFIGLILGLIMKVWSGKFAPIKSI